VSTVSTSRSPVTIVGAGLSRFGRQPGVSGRQMALSAIRAALADAGLAWSDVQIAYGGSDGSGLADTLVSDLGLTGIPFTNVKNGCATGGTALASAVQAIRSGAADIALAVGFDKHPRGAFDPRPEEWGLPAGYGEAGLMVTTQFFGIKIARYMNRYGITSATLAKVAAKAYRNGALNENAWRREAMDEVVIASADMVNDPLTRYMFCSPGEGGAAVVVASEAAARRLDVRPVRLLAAVTRTRGFGSFEVFSPAIQGSDEPSSVSTAAAEAAFEEAGVGAADIEVAQLQDTESGAEIMHMAECGFCEHGDQEKWIANGETEIGGRLPVNTDGGCIANGEPIGASGLRQVHEIVTQLRGEAGARQVAGAPRLGFTHVYGAPGISACTVLAV
jgi:acetyl-CoA acyltransferase